MARKRTSGVSLRTVSILWGNDVGLLGGYNVDEFQSSLEIGDGASIVVPGHSFFNARIMAAQCPAPGRGRSSRSTDVITTCLSFRSFTERTMSVISCGLIGSGFPVATLQNLQLRGAYVSAYRESGSSVAPAFATVWTRAGRAYCVQMLLVEKSDHLRGLESAGQFYLKPVRFATEVGFRFLLVFGFHKHIRKKESKP